MSVSLVAGIPLSYSSHALFQGQIGPVCDNILLAKLKPGQVMHTCSKTILEPGKIQ